MISAGWRRLGINPAAFAVLGLVAIAMLLSRGAGAGWLVVVAAMLLGALGTAVVSGVLGSVGLRVACEVPTDCVAGETITIGITVRSLLPQLRTVTLIGLDNSTHSIEGNSLTRVAVLAERRAYVREFAVEVRGGLPLGLVRPSRHFRINLSIPLAVGPVPATVSLLDSIGEDPTAQVRTVRAYTPGDAARLVHWRSTARRGELMVRELESAEVVSGSGLQIRVSLDGDEERAEAVASHAAGLAIAALNAGLSVELLTSEGNGLRGGEVRTRREVGRRLAAAVPGAAPAATARRVVELGP